MAIRGVSKKPIPYLPEEERSNTEDPTVFHLVPKTGHQSNVTMQRYAAAGRDGRKGYRELNVNKLDNADLAEFLDICVKVENWYFSDQYPDLESQGLFKDIQDPELLKRVCQDMSSELLLEVFEAANNLSTLKAGEKKSSSSSPTSPSGKAKKGSE
tara:strand:+ start:1300 stop:1767 length:468 start_codon:yes stop_codon:yes gene_type:complete